MNLLPDALEAVKNSSTFHLQPGVPGAPADMAESNMVLYACVVLVKALAAGGGIGGGGMLVPLFLVVAKVPPDRATPLSVIAIAGGAVANYIHYGSRRKADGSPLVDYRAALLILPPMLAGTTLGTMANRVLPQWLIVILMFIVLLTATWRTVKKGLQSWQAENRQRREKAATDMLPLCSAAADSVGHLGLRVEQPLYPARLLTTTALAWLLVFAIALLQGGHGAPSVLGLECGSRGYWLLALTSWASLLVFTVMVRRSMLMDLASESHRKGSSEESPGGGSWRQATALRWSSSNTAYLPLVSVLCGATAGLLGIGGGMIIGPLLLELGLENQAVAATGAFIVLVSDSSVAAQFALLGMLRSSDALPLFATGYLGTSIGQFVCDRAIRKTGRSSVVVFVIAAVIAFSTVTMGILGLKRLNADLSGGDAGGAGTTGFRELCS